jgi:hypothetical protein
MKLDVIGTCTMGRNHERIYTEDYRAIYRGDYNRKGFGE